MKDRYKQVEDRPNCAAAGYKQQPVITGHRGWSRQNGVAATRNRNEKSVEIRMYLIHSGINDNFV